MTTSITISSYVDTITDEQFREIIDDATTRTVEDVQVDVSLMSITTCQTGYGTWRLVCDFEIDGRRVTLYAQTHSEELILASGGADYRDFDYSQEEADRLIVEQVIAKNIDEFLVESKTTGTNA